MLSEFNLPRIVYIGDVPIESSYHGSALLSRLLEDYSTDKLLIIEGNLQPSNSKRRLENVRYESLRAGNERLLRTRYHTIYSSYLTWSAARHARQVDKLRGKFEPDAVLTVAHGYSWLAADRFAVENKLPLHLICHDDWPNAANVSGWYRATLQRKFAAAYRRARSRLCVSPFMRDTYQKRYGVDGDILLPSRSANCPTYDSPPTRLMEPSHSFVAAFAGTFYTADYVRSLRIFADVLQKVGGRLVLFGPLQSDAARRNGLELKNVELRGLLPSPQLIEDLRKDVDLLFLPMSFSESDRPNMELSFPSKLTDYTAAGLPLLIWGPEYCSAVRWARQNSGVAEVATCHTGEALQKSVEHLRGGPLHRWRLAERAIEIGRRDFSYDRAKAVFERALKA